MEDLLELLNEFGGMLDVRVFLGIAAAVVVFAVEVKLFGGYRKSNRRKERAAARGHVVKMKLKSAWDDDTSGYSVDSWFHAAYAYVVDGVSYQYRYLGKVRPPSVTTWTIPDARLRARRRSLACSPSFSCFCRLSQGQQRSRSSAWCSEQGCLP